MREREGKKEKEEPDFILSYWLHDRKMSHISGCMVPCK